MDELETTTVLATLLVVDDDTNLLRALERQLTARHFRTVCASSAERAMALLENRRFDAIVTDLELPTREDGIFAVWASRAFPDVPIVVITGDDSLQVVHARLQSARVDAVMPKPFAIADLEAIVQAAIRRAGRASSSPHADARRIADGLVRGLALRDVETEGHSRRVAEWTRMLAAEMGLDEDMQIDCELGGLLHDIGKIGIPDAILLKPGKLTEEEWTVMRRHTLFGFATLGGIPLLEEASKVVLNHHERWDGAGYPKGLAGEAIPIGARLFAVADTYDAMTSDRPYRAALPHERAVQEISSLSGKQFDPAVVRAFLAIDRARWRLVRECYADEETKAAA